MYPQLVQLRMANPTESICPRCRHARDERAFIRPDRNERAKWCNICRERGKRQVQMARERARMLSPAGRLGSENGRSTSEPSVAWSPKETGRASVSMANLTPNTSSNASELLQNSFWGAMGADTSASSPSIRSQLSTASNGNVLSARIPDKKHIVALGASTDLNNALSDYTLSKSAERSYIASLERQLHTTEELYHIMKRKLEQIHSISQL